MELRIFTEPQQGATYDELLAVARATEAAGLDAFFRSDHYLSIGRNGGTRAALGPTDAWTTLAGLARETTRIRLGTLMTAATFRLPGPLAVTVAEVDAMSGGRVELGIGAGWYVEEHRAFGIPYPEATAERFERFEEQLAIITGLWETAPGQPFSFQGRHYQLQDNPSFVKPVQRPRPPIIVGGRGLKRTPRIAARFADEFNMAFQPLDNARVVLSAVDEACSRCDRDPASLIRSAALTTICGRDESELVRRAEAIGRDLDSLRDGGLAGTPGEIAERMAQWAALGVSRIYLQLLDLTDLEQIAFIGDELLDVVAPL